MSERVAPSFAVTADEFLRADRAMDAARLCAEGLKRYPDYAGGYLILADAYTALGQAADARIILDEARRRFPRYSGVTRRMGPLTAKPVAVPPAPVSAPVSAPVLAPVSAPEPTAPVPTKAAPAPPPPTSPSPLRVINTADLATDSRIIRSASVRLIPGLEYTTLRFEGMRSRGRREITFLADPPPFRSFHVMRRVQRPTEPVKEQRKAVSLEELAARLEKARIPTVTEMARQAPVPPPPMGGPTVVTETIAMIYMQQGSFDRAIEAFRVLQSTKPEKHEHFERLIAECERARTER